VNEFRGKADIASAKVWAHPHCGNRGWGWTAETARCRPVADIHLPEAECAPSMRPTSSFLPFGDVLATGALGFAPALREPDQSQNGMCPSGV